MYNIDTKLNYSGCVYPTQIGAIKHVHKRFFSFKGQWKSFLINKYHYDKKHGRGTWNLTLNPIKVARS